MTKLLKLAMVAAMITFTALISVPAQAQSVPEIVGTWHGTAKTPAGDITLVLHAERGEDGTLSAKLIRVRCPIKEVCVIKTVRMEALSGIDRRKSTLSPTRITSRAEL